MADASTDRLLTLYGHRAEVVMADAVITFPLLGVDITVPLRICSGIDGPLFRVDDLRPIIDAINAAEASMTGERRRQAERMARRHALRTALATTTGFSFTDERLDNLIDAVEDVFGG